jgi:hypothetical protein
MYIAANHTALEVHHLEVQKGNKEQVLHAVLFLLCETRRKLKKAVGGSWQHQTKVQPCALHLFPDIMKSKNPRGSKKEKKKKTITNHLWYRVRKMRSFNERMGPKKGEK